MTSVWAVTRTTFVQCLRSKVGVACMGVLTVLLVAIPLMVNERSAPLADRIRTFLAYSVGLTAIILCLATILASTAFITGEVQKKQIFFLAAKPLARWQYIIGRWLGVVLLDVVMLVLAGVGIYAGAQYLHGRPSLTPTDRRAVETEVFTARRKISPDYSGDNKVISDAVQARIEKCKQEGSLEQMLSNFSPRANGDRDQAMEMVRQDFEKTIRERIKSIPPNTFSRPYFFRDVNILGASQSVGATVEKVFEKEGVMQLTLPTQTTDRLMLGRPLDVNGAISHIVDIDTGVVFVQVAKDPFFAKGLSLLKKGDHVDVVVEPFVQLTYKLSPGSNLQGPVKTNWRFDPITPGQGLWDQIMQGDLPNVPITVSVSAKCLDKSGGLVAIFYNDNFGTPATTASITIEPSDISLLYAVGTFEANFIRALGLLLVIVMFIAALGTLASSFLSFYVAVLMTVVLVLFTVLSGFISDAVSFMPMEGINIPLHAIAFVLQLLLPNLSSLVPTTSLVGGEEISFLGETLRPLLMSLGGTVMVLAMACVIFTKRELARVQV